MLMNRHFCALFQQLCIKGYLAHSGDFQVNNATTFTNTGIVNHWKKSNNS